jgi:hypothetical protein
MLYRNLIIPVLIIFSLLPANAQVKKKETGLKREVTLYNPYKPSLPESQKRSFLPDLNDTSKVRPDFRYDVKTTPFLPEYTISPIKAASLIPDPLPKLYKGYINLGIGNYLTPLAEVSITNERSKKGSIGFYGRHFSSNGKSIWIMARWFLQDIWIMMSLFLVVNSSGTISLKAQSILVRR